MSYPKYGQPARFAPQRAQFEPFQPQAEMQVVPGQTAFSPGGEKFTNLYEEEAKMAWDPAMYHLYQQLAIRASLEFGSSSVLDPLMMGDQTDITTTTETHPNIPISMNADIRTRQLEYYIDKPCFIRRVSGTINGLMVHPVAVSGFDGPAVAGTEPQALYEIPFDGMRPWDMIYGQWRIDGSNKLLQDRFMPLSVLLGTGVDTYFYDLIPVLVGGTRLRLDLTIDVPGNPAPLDQAYFVSRVGLITVQLHIEQFTFTKG